MRYWLKENKLTHVAKESIWVCWKPVYNILEEDFELQLVIVRHIKNVPVQKTDKRDSKWIVKLLLSGLLNGSFISPNGIRELRDLTRYRRKVEEQISCEKNWIHKLLEDANIKLSSVVSNLSGSTVTKIIDAMIEGEEDIKELVKLRHGKMQATVEDIAKSLKGKLSEHHKFMLQTVKAYIESNQTIISKNDAQIDKQLKNCELELDA